MLTSALSNEIVFNRFRESEDRDEVIKFILTGGKPKETKHCSECREILSAEILLIIKQGSPARVFYQEAMRYAISVAKRLIKKEGKSLRIRKFHLNPKPGQDALIAQGGGLGIGIGLMTM